MNRRIAFDVSETITSWPFQCRELIASLLRDGWEVFVLSPNDIESIYRDLQAAGIERHSVQVINRIDKGQACKEYEIAILLDDNPQYQSGVKKHSPTTMPLLVISRDGMV